MLLTKKTYDAEKQRLYDEQNGICPICNQPLDPEVNKNHLDHDHALDGPRAGRVRGLLHNVCNGSEGRTLHEFKRSGLVAKGVDYLDYLESLIRYLKRDTLGSALHPQYPADLKKRFKRLTRQEMIDELLRLGFAFDPDGTKETLIKNYNKQITKSLK